MPGPTYDWATETDSFLVNVYVNGAAPATAVAPINGGTGFYAAWSAGFAILGRLMRSNGTFATGEQVVNGVVAGNQDDSSITQLVGGNIVVTYTDYSVNPGGDLRARLIGAIVDHRTQELHADVKGVTKHLYHVSQEAGHWKALVVLDV